MPLVTALNLNHFSASTFLFTAHSYCKFHTFEDHDVTMVKRLHFIVAFFGKCEQICKPFVTMIVLSINLNNWLFYESVEIILRP